MSSSQPLRKDRTDLDDRDEDILFERVTRRAHIAGPRVGDFCILKTGEVRRFTHDHGDSLQVTVKDQAGSFYFDASGALDYSGSLDPSIKRANLKERLELREGACWFFHHGVSRAHNGVTAMIPCRVYDEVDVKTEPVFEDVTIPDIVPVTEDIVFDEKDAAILGTAMKFRAIHFKPLVGDYVILASGEVQRLAFAYSNRFQITTPRFTCSFHLHDVGTMSCSGAFPESLATADLEDTGITRAARAWIFHHGKSGGGRGVDSGPCVAGGGPMSKQLDIHQTVTDTIVAAIERGVGEWKMPWHQGNGLSFIPANIEGHSYHGVNCIHLFCCALHKHYSTNTWGSFRQLQKAGLQVRKGEKASIVVFYKSITVEPDAEREEDDGTRRVLKHYSVFNVEQCDGWVPKVAPPLAPAFERLDHAERVFGATGATVVVGGDSACYVRDADFIKMPDAGLFHGDMEQRREAFYATLAHELVHWTGAPHRLNREKGKTFSDAVYAFEELIADAGAAMVCAELGISPVVREEHAEYISHWLKHLKEDKKAIFRAAARASEAVRYITSFSESGAHHAKAA